MNPYVKISVTRTESSGGDRARQQQRRTRVAMRGNATPNWNQDFVFDLDAYTKTLSLVCCDSDLVNGDTIIGMAEVDLAKPLSRQGETVEQTVVIKDTNVANRGEVISRCLHSLLKP